MPIPITQSFYFLIGVENNEIIDEIKIVVAQYWFLTLRLKYAAYNSFVQRYFLMRTHLWENKNRQIHNRRLEIDCQCVDPCQCLFLSRECSLSCVLQFGSFHS